MTVRIHMYNALGRIPLKLESEILAGVNHGVRLLSEQIALTNVDLSIIQSDVVHWNTGVGGIAYGPESCAIYVDPYNDNLPANISLDLPAITIHELHHVLRMRTIDFRGTADWCGGALVVLEGLATQAQSFFGFGKPANVCDVTVEDVGLLLQRLVPIAGDKKADFNWIYEPNGLPWQIYKAQYPMGYHLVGAYLDKVEKNPIEALADPWEEIWETGLKELGLK